MDRDSAESEIESQAVLPPGPTGSMTDQVTAASDGSAQLSAAVVADQQTIAKSAAAPHSLPVLKIPQKQDEPARLWLLRDDRLFIAASLTLGLSLLFYHWVRLSRWGAEPIEIDRLLERRANYRIDINHATKYELAELDGIGPALALRIVEDREKNGPFKSPEEIIRVNGIGPKIFEKLKPHLQASEDFPSSSKSAPQRQR